MKFIQFSDIQLGTYIGKPVPLPHAAIAIYQSTLDVLKALDIIIERARNENPDFILIPGDIFDRAVNSRYILRSLALRLGKLSQIAPVIAVIGNHDIVGNISMMSDWMQLPLQNIYIFDEPSIISLKAKNGKEAQFACVGWPVSVLSELDSVNKNLSEETKDSRQNFHYLINDFLKNAPLSMNKNAIKVFVGHGTVLNFFTKEEIKYIKETINEDIVFYQKNLSNYDYCAIGHIHVPKFKDNIAYAGSLYPANFGESSFEHGFLIVNIDDETKKMTVTHSPIHIRNFYNANIKTSEFKDESDIVSYILEKFSPDEEAFIKVSIRFDDPSSDIHLSVIESSLRDYYNHVIVEPVYSTKKNENIDVSFNLAPVQPGETLIQIVSKYLARRTDISDEIKERTKIKLRTYINLVMD